MIVLPRFRLILLGLLTVAATAAAPVAALSAGDPFEQEWTEVADGVWTGIRPNSPRSPVQGTTVIVVGSRGVLLFDGAGYAVQGERVAAKVKSLTNKPVTHIAISHWHGDHHLGNHEILKIFPHAEIVSHSFTRAAMTSPLMDYIKDGQKNGAANIAKQLSAILKKGALPDGSSLPAALRAYYQQIMADIDFLDRELRRVRITAPTRVFDRRMTVDLGGRKAELRHLGRANTKGDIILYLPAEKIVATGDMVVRPTPYGFGSYPRSWAAALRKLKELEFDLLVPGHGDPQSDTAYVDLLIETMELIADQVEPLVMQGLDLEAVRKKVDFSSVEERFTRGDAFLASRFDAWFKRPIVEAAYNVAAGTGNESLDKPEEN